MSNLNQQVIDQIIAIASTGLERSIGKVDLSDFRSLMTREISLHDWVLRRSNTRQENWSAAGGSEEKYGYPMLRSLIYGAWATGKIRAASSPSSVQAEMSAAANRVIPSLARKACDEVIRCTRDAAREAGYGANASEYDQVVNLSRVIKSMSTTSRYMLALGTSVATIVAIRVATHMVTGSPSDWEPELKMDDLPSSVLSEEWNVLWGRTESGLPHYRSIRDQDAEGRTKTLQLFGACLSRLLAGEVELPDVDELMEELFPHRGNMSYRKAGSNTNEADNEGAIMTEATAVTETEINLPTVQDSVEQIINSMLKTVGTTLGYNEIVARINNSSKEKAEAARRIRELEEEVKAARAAASRAVAVPSVVKGDGKLPDGKTVQKKAGEVFPSLKGTKAENMEVTCYEWDAPHPDVPAIDENYLFREEMLVPVLVSLRDRENAWLQGHSGSGKTTLVEQICARTGQPMARIAMDSGIDRAELIGKESLKGDGKGGTISEWVPGVLERAMANNYVLCFDEIDCARPDTLYVVQPILEGKPLRILEDGGREVLMAPGSRIVATGNTQGNGDESGLYPATRTLTAATLDRFTRWVKVPYMTQDEEEDLLVRVTGISKKVAKSLALFAKEMRAAFVGQQIPVSFSPRRTISFAKCWISLTSVGYDQVEAMEVSLRACLLDACPEEFRQRVTEIASASLLK